MALSSVAKSRSPIYKKLNKTQNVNAYILNAIKRFKAVGDKFAEAVGVEVNQKVAEAEREYCDQIKDIPDGYREGFEYEFVISGGALRVVGNADSLQAAYKKRLHTEKKSEKAKQEAILRQDRVKKEGFNRLWFNKGVSGVLMDGDMRISPESSQFTLTVKGKEVLAEFSMYDLLASREYDHSLQCNSGGNEKIISEFITELSLLVQLKLDRFNHQISQYEGQFNPTPVASAIRSISSELSSLSKALAEYDDSERVIKGLALLNKDKLERDHRAAVFSIVQSEESLMLQVKIGGKVLDPDYFEKAQESIHGLMKRYDACIEDRDQRINKALEHRRSSLLKAHQRRFGSHIKALKFQNMWEILDLSQNDIDLVAAIKTAGTKLHAASSLVVAQAIADWNKAAERISSEVGLMEKIVLMKEIVSRGESAQTQYDLFNKHIKQLEDEYPAMISYPAFQEKMKEYQKRCEKFFHIQSGKWVISLNKIKKDFLKNNPKVSKKSPPLKYKATPPSKLLESSCFEPITTGLQIPAGGYDVLVSIKATAYIFRAIEEGASPNIYAAKRALVRHYIGVLKRFNPSDPVIGRLHGILGHQLQFMDAGDGLMDDMLHAFTNPSIADAVDGIESVLSSYMQFDKRAEKQFLWSSLGGDKVVVKRIAELVQSLRTPLPEIMCVTTYYKKLDDLHTLSVLMRAKNGSVIEKLSKNLGEEVYVTGDDIAKFLEVRDGLRHRIDILQTVNQGYETLRDALLEQRPRGVTMGVKR